MTSCRVEKRHIRRKTADRYIPFNTGISKFNAWRYSSGLTSSLKDESKSRDSVSCGPVANLSSQNGHESAIAAALGFRRTNKVLNFSNEESSIGQIATGPAPQQILQMCSSTADWPESANWTDPEWLDYMNSISHNPPPPRHKEADQLLSERVLDAPDLLNDYYSNLVAWSKSRNIVAVALKTLVYFWSAPKGPQLVPLPNSVSCVSCVAFSTDKFLAVSRKDGSVTVLDMNLDKPPFTYYHSASIGYLIWTPGKDDDLYIGDQCGDVLHLRIVQVQQYSDHQRTECSYAPLQISVIRGHTHQICGISFSPDLTQLAIGGNDNMATVWDIRDVSKPLLLFHMPHNAAVKALAFCPWLPSLLATGGGSNDRTVKFWHTKSGTLLESYNVKHQVTSLIWSKNYKQLVATFGFGDPQDPLTMAVYSFPGFQQLKNCRMKTPSTRALSAVCSPDDSTLCLAVSNQTLQFFKIWEPKPRFNQTTSENPAPAEVVFDPSGIFGSPIIDMLEGNDLYETLMR